ncbi:MAG: hypothetical protein COB36_10860 [Alphaproteobacteria bacterium]|nr:MAG: hypothetical protein COB36_10860 [Alphaproteobacteria bacterium]
MSEVVTVEADLSIEMNVHCPNDECGSYIDLLNSSDTDEHDHNDDGYLLSQMFPKNGDNTDFECEDVTCSKCKTRFNVKGLAW